MVKAWDLRRNAVIFSMTGHTDTITSMRVSPDSGGDFLLTNAMVLFNIFRPLSSFLPIFSHFLASDAIKPKTLCLQTMYLQGSI